MDFKNSWENLGFGIPLDIFYKVHVINIEAYMPDLKAHAKFCEDMPILKQNKYIFCYDLTVEDSSGYLIKVLLAPNLSSIQRGKLKIGSYIEMKTVKKMNINGHFLMLNEWSNGGNFEASSISQWSDLSNYRSKNKFLGSKDIYKLQPWTLQFYMWSQSESVSVVKRIPNLQNAHHQSLKQLDNTWTMLAQKCALTVRVLAKSKERLILQPTNERKPWSVLCNLLVADRTAYSVVTFWDEAVKNICQNVSEGDILFFDKSYSVGRYFKKTCIKVHPKQRIGLSPTEIEIKVNPADMRNISILTSSSTFNIPPPLWNFATSLGLVDLPSRNILDIIGCIVYYGRWERERCYDEARKPTGQFWVRLWLILVDHLSDNLIKVKLFVNPFTWKNLELLHPGEPVIITNLINNKDESEKHSYLSSTNETEVFRKNRLKENRFEKEKIVDSFKKSITKELKRWTLILKKFGGIGGYNPRCQIYEKSSQRNIFEKRCQVRHHMKKLMWKETDRMLVKAIISEIKVFQNTPVTDYSHQNSTIEVIGNMNYTKRNIILPISGLYSDDMKTQIGNVCLLKLDIVNSQTIPNVSSKPRQTIIVKLLLSDCQILAESTHSLEDLNSHPEGQPLLVNLNLFRYQEPEEMKADWDGVLIVIDAINLDIQSKPLDSTASTSSYVPNTCDIAKLFE